MMQKPEQAQLSEINRLRSRKTYSSIRKGLDFICGALFVHNQISGPGLIVLTMIMKSKTSTLVDWSVLMPMKVLRNVVLVLNLYMGFCTLTS